MKDDKGYLCSLTTVKGSSLEKRKIYIYQKRRKIYKALRVLFVCTQHIKIEYIEIHIVGIRL